MYHCVGSLALVALVACGGKRDDKPTPTPVAPEPTAGASEAPQPPLAKCEQLPFAETTAVPEASGAAWLEIDGKLALVVVSDSGHDGGFGLIDPDDGTTRAQGKLPLGKGASEDIEGLAARGTRLYGLTSSGYMREWEWKGGAFALVAGPYPIGAGDMVCTDVAGFNCAKNYEGPAIAPAPIGACAAYACSKATGAIYCLGEAQGKLAATGAPAIEVAHRKDILADCAFSPEGKLYVGYNLFGLAHTLRVDDLDKTNITLRDLGPLGTGFPEVVAARGDIIYRMSDLGGNAPSAMLKFRCTVDGG